MREMREGRGIRRAFFTKSLMDMKIIRSEEDGKRMEVL